MTISVFLIFIYLLNCVLFINSRKAPMSHMRHQFKSDEDMEKFMVWALGEGYGHSLISDTPEIWNARHGDKLFILGTDFVRDAQTKMISVYKSEMNKS